VLRTEEGKACWAPAVVYVPEIDRPYVMLYSQGAGSGDLAHRNQRLFRADALTPEGPFVPSGHALTPELDFAIDPEILWQMSRSEKYCFINFVKHLKPNVAIEIGTFKGGSLQVLSKFSDKVYSIDISDGANKSLAHKFTNTEFLVGKSHEIIPGLLKEIEAKGQHLGFVLIDGDHSVKGVQRDIKAVIEYPHKKQVVIFMHDAFNPQVRKGIRSIDYKKYPHVKYAELDYICGSTVAFNKAYTELWGGFAMILIDPLHTEGTRLKKSFENMQRRLYLSSIHIVKDPIQSLIMLKRKIFR
jgi:hypothetical protein